MRCFFREEFGKLIEFIWRVFLIIEHFSRCNLRLIFQLFRNHKRLLVFEAIAIAVTDKEMLQLIQDTSGGFCTNVAAAGCTYRVPFDLWMFCLQMLAEDVFIDVLELTLADEASEANG